jgi:hypothetical protein
MRKTNWYIDFVDVMKDQIDDPHIYGETDCLCQVSEGVEAITGIDHAGKYAGRYTSYEEVLELLKSDGYKDPEDYLLKNGFYEIPVIDAEDGDIGAIEVGDILGYGQFFGSKLLVQTLTGKGRLPRSRAIKAYRVE